MPQPDDGLGAPWTCKYGPFEGGPGIGPVPEAKVAAGHVQQRLPAFFRKVGSLQVALVSGNSLVVSLGFAQAVRQVKERASVTPFGPRSSQNVQFSPRFFLVAG